MAVYTGRWTFDNHEHPRHRATGTTTVHASTDNIAKTFIREAGARTVFGAKLMLSNFIATKVKRKGRGRQWHPVR
jgi:hypothetical protein